MQATPTQDKAQAHTIQRNGTFGDKQGPVTAGATGLHQTPILTSSTYFPTSLQTTTMATHWSFRQVTRKRHLGQTAFTLLPIPNNSKRQG
ncbi:hypothetical protein SDC9_80131 [bioreactor metagenome]|uniref:Uncharacterized protein n=1 Tax=bioreactor metagenome TaxID=1076179 RepID=A0A644YY64_9ZZZZ